MRSLANTGSRRWWRPRLMVVALTVLVAGAGLHPGNATASPTRPKLTKFRPRVVTQQLYAIQEPTHDPERQQHYVAMSDGIQLFAEVWLPAPKDGNVPPERVPTIVSMTPYVTKGQLDGDNDSMVKNMVPRGYAVAQVHVRGTGASEGCFNYFGAVEQRDIGEVLNWLAHAKAEVESDEAWWSDGRLGLYGISYRGTTALEAVTLANKDLTKAVKAAVIAAPTASMYDAYVGIDGVPRVLTGAVDQLLAPINVAIGRGDAGADTFTCAAAWDYATHVKEHDGDFFDAVDERELRKGASTIRVPVLMSHGHYDDGEINPSMGQAGLFDRIPADVPKAGVFGHFGHEWPDGDGWDELREGKASDQQLINTVPEWTRDDWQDMVAAWFDHFVKGRPSGVEAWPVAQVQNNEGWWRAEPEWPLTGGPVGHLALSAGGKLGELQPVGTTSYVDGAYRNQNLYELEQRLQREERLQELAREGHLSTNGYPPGTSASFEFVATDRLEFSGQAELNLWVAVEGPIRDAHVTAMIETFDESGVPIPYGTRVGARSVQHLDPITDYFKQRQAFPPPDGVFPVTIRLAPPSGLIVPSGGKLRLTVAGSAPVDAGLGIGDGFEHPTQLSGSGARVTIVHDCQHTSELRFAMPRQDAEWLDVKTVEPDEMVDHRDLPTVFDGGRATEPVCGGPPPNAVSTFQDPPAPVAIR